MDIDIRHHERGGAGTYALYVDGIEAGELEYWTSFGTRVITHTGVRPQLEGLGLGGRLARRALDDARAAGLAVDPRCSFVARYVQRHPEDADLLASAR